MQGQLSIFGNRPQAYAIKNLFASYGLWKKQSRLNVQVIISSVTLCEKKKKAEICTTGRCCICPWGDQQLRENYSGLA